MTKPGRVLFALCLSTRRCEHAQNRYSLPFHSGKKESVILSSAMFGNHAHVGRFPEGGDSAQGRDLDDCQGRSRHLFEKLPRQVGIIGDRLCHHNAPTLHDRGR